MIGAADRAFSALGYYVLAAALMGQSIAILTTRPRP